ncbi:MAG: hypothetical protein RLY31_3143 [Bacteroidota bacterium]
MYIIFFLIIISLTIAAGFLGAFLWAVHSGQFEDDFTPAVRMLFDDVAAASPESPEENLVETDKHQKSQA